ncbi:hypothetical protein [Anaerotignum propionicum]|uniref:Uncharacterized protein n=1 Tax=Anaerotignum propionicum DSM 1682 TaxID=991789 RepID=A0A110A748_ANAPI|nr:hypothetical protein [Anaerotignum propionicum]AMJ40511.1 hypothetical protein CPRO_09120 [Anaerotignum propionicum DSM 1682]SHE40143.1 hypothetical protein SAMN02745151_00572 [[Clostridium] propionicum DSM 1682] [Anaerotignum propionicum DSM 1682]
MTDIEKIFSEEWMKKAEQAKGLEGYNSAKLIKEIQQYGGVSVARRALSRNGCSDNFEILKKSKWLDLSMEALIVKGEYGSLFEDDEVNQCFALLCECDYFG